jgi:predicted RNA methylase
MASFAMNTLFNLPPVEDHGVITDQQKALSQFFTPSWVGPELFAAHFSDLPAGANVLEPSCGRGHMLSAIPEEFDAWGVEIDPVLAEEARQNTGRPVLVGDFLELEVDKLVDACFGNPPFDYSWVSRFLDRVTLKEGGKAGFILPAYMLQTSASVCRWNRKWSISQELLPRDLFPNLRLPLTFCLFQRDERPRLVGLRLYKELDEMKELKPDARKALFTNVVPMGGVWKSLVAQAIAANGGRAGLDEVYSWVGRTAPKTNRFWKEKVRQTLYRYFARVDGQEWGCAAA